MSSRFHAELWLLWSYRRHSLEVPFKDFYICITLTFKLAPLWGPKGLQWKCKTIKRYTPPLNQKT